MTLLDAVAWPGVLEDLLDHATDDTCEAAYHYATTGDPMWRRGLAFALLVARSQKTLKPLLCRHTSLSHGQVHAVADWLTRTALGMTGMMVNTVTVPTEAPVDGTLWLDPALPDLPLLPLAADLAARTGGLRIELGDLPPGVCGVADQQRRIVRLSRSHAAAAWPHELSHQLDPMLGQRGDPALDERFADHLGSLLASYRPGSYQGAAEYIDQALAIAAPVDNRGRQPHHPGYLPAPGIESVLAFSTLPLTARDT